MKRGRCGGCQGQQSLLCCPSGVTPPVHNTDAAAGWDVCVAAVEPACDVLVYSFLTIVYSSLIILLRMRVLAGLTIISFRPTFSLLAFISSSRRHFS